MTDDVDVVVLREGTEGLSMADYAAELRDRLPGFDVRHAATPRAERDLVARARVVTGLRFDRDLLDRADRLRLFAATSSGVGHLPLDALREAGVAVTNAAGIHAAGIAEQVLGYLLTFARNLHVARDRQRRGEWRHYQSTELKGSTVTVVGLGAIGHAVVERLQGFGVDTIGVRYTPEKGGPTDEVVGFETDALHDALARTDHLVVASPLTDETRGLVGREELVTLPPSAVVVNVARGPIVDTDALVWALRSNTIRGAALDVTDPEPLPGDHSLWALDNCLLTPHAGGHTPEHWPRLAEIVAGNTRLLADRGSGIEELENLVANPSD